MDNTEIKPSATVISSQPQAQKPKKQLKNLLVPVFSIVMLLGIFSAVYFLKFLSNKKQDFVKTDFKPVSNSNKLPKSSQILASNFAEYQEVEVNINPSLEPYSVKQDWSNIINKDDFDNQYFLTDTNAKDLLTKNSFVVIPSYGKEFFPIYENNRYNFIPNFITTDSVLHNYHLFFDYLLRKTEEDKLIPELKKLNQNILSSALKQYNLVKGTQWENAAKRNIGFFAVAGKLLDSNIEVPPMVKDLVDQEMKLIDKHEGIKESPVMNIGPKDNTILSSPQGPLGLEALKEDYSQYIPRGHYDRSNQLKAYFKSMMWYGRLTFRFKNEDEIKSAILINFALKEKDNFVSWQKIYEPTNFFVGKSDDINYYQLNPLVEKIYGQNILLTDLINQKTRFTEFIKGTKSLDPPKINSIPIFQASIQPDREEEIEGFRFMGQRYVVDADIFQRLLTREVGPKNSTCDQAPFDEGRMLPKGLDIPSAMGSSTALSILKSQGETDYACYPENMSKMTQYISSLPVKTWTQNLYWTWLYSLKPLNQQKTAGYPSFMLNDAWNKKDLNTYLGSWTELKHDTILYAKQAYSELGGGPTKIEKKDDRGYVEPNVYVYARLASLLNMTNQGLELRNLLDSSNKENLARMEQLVLSLKTISEKELNNQSLSKEDYDLIRSFGGQLEHFWLEVNKEDMKDKNMGMNTYLCENPAAIVADVATNPNGSVLEEATGYISTIYVVVPVEGQLKIAKGGVYSYYEFSWPMQDRLTDKKWRQVLQSEDKPDLPQWTNSFISN